MGHPGTAQHRTACADHCRQPQSHNKHCFPNVCVQIVFFPACERHQICCNSRRFQDTCLRSTSAFIRAPHLFYTCGEMLYCTKTAKKVTLRFSIASVGKMKAVVSNDLHSCIFTSKGSFKDNVQQGFANDHCQDIVLPRTQKNTFWARYFKRTSERSL